jgi:RNA polymerase sporulation-specific sigma factor
LLWMTLGVEGVSIGRLENYNPHLGWKDEVIPTCKPLIMVTAKRFRWAVSRCGVDMDDLISEAWVGLIKAFEHYKPTPGKEAKFSTYSVPWVEGEIRKFIRDKATVARPSQDLYSLAGRILKDSLEQDSAFDISAKLACSPKAAREALRYLRESRSASLDAELPSDDGESLTLLDKLGAADDLSQLRVNEFLASLTAEERAFIQMRTERIQPDLYAADKVEQLLQQVSRKCFSYMNVTESEVKKMSTVLTKEKYLEFKKQGMSDADILSTYQMGSKSLTKRKREWGIAITRGGRRFVKPEQSKPTPSVSQAPMEPDQQEKGPAKPVFYASPIQDYDIVKQLQEQVERLLAENGLLKGLIKIYL